MIMAMGGGRERERETERERQRIDQTASWMMRTQALRDEIQSISSISIAGKQQPATSK
jgi:hypothetical protein